MTFNQGAFYGVNFAGGDFGQIGQAYGTGYIYPDASTLDYFARKGMKMGRLPFKWERIQPRLGQPLDPAELARLKEFVRLANDRGIEVLLNVHNYGEYQNVSAGWKKHIGTPEVPISTFADSCRRRLATEFKGSAGIAGYGLMNEPQGFPNGFVWPQAAQAGVDAIRAIDPDTTIVVSGDCWSSAYEWPNCS